MTDTELAQPYYPSMATIAVVDGSVLKSAPDTARIKDHLGRYVDVYYTRLFENTLSGIAVVGGNGNCYFGTGSVVTDARDKYTSIPELSEAVEKLEQSGGGGGGTKDYTQLLNKPRINSIELNGNKSLSTIGATEYSDTTTVKPIKFGIDGDQHFTIEY